MELIGETRVCTVCGKEKDLSLFRKNSKESILKEIQKCVCLCANCHRKVHASKIELEVC